MKHFGSKIGSFFGVIIRCIFPTLIGVDVNAERNKYCDHSALPNKTKRFVRPSISFAWQSCSYSSL